MAHSLLRPRVLLGIGLLAWDLYVFTPEARAGTAPTAHLVYHGAWALVALLVMGLGATLAAGVKLLGGAAAPYLPWLRKKDGDT